MKKQGRRETLIVSFFCMALLLFSGCTILKVNQEKKESVDYTVVKEEDLPKDLVRLIEEKKKKEFEMTYKSEDYLYLIKGYGEQITGGFSIRIDELYKSENGLFLKTTLLGPMEGEKQAKEPSYPYLVIKMPYCKEPVKFLS